MNNINFLFQAIRCYQCGTEYVNMADDLSSKSRADDMENTLLTLESCGSLDYTFSSWGLSAVDCGTDQVCVKTIVDEGVDEHGRHRGYFTSSRGCAMKYTAQGFTHRMDCGILKTNAVPPTDMIADKYHLICFCNADYCNKANRSCEHTCLLLWTLIALLCFVEKLFTS